MIYKIIKTIIIINIYYMSIYCNGIYNYFSISKKTETIFHRVVETSLGFLFIATFPIILQCVFCFISTKIRNRYIRIVFEFTIPTVMFFWMCYQIKYGQGPQGEADVNEFSPFIERLFTSIYVNGPLLLGVMIIRRIFIEKRLGFLKPYGVSSVKQDDD